jgi:chromatin assembly factor 1 subunit B
MRFRTLEIRWHDSKPIASCDFQHVPFKKARPNSDKAFTSQSYRLATGGEDNHVRVSTVLRRAFLRVLSKQIGWTLNWIQIWMVHPNIMPPSLVEGASSSATAAATRPPRIEYLATLGRHSAAVNVVRFSPNGALHLRVLSRPWIDPNTQGS